MGAGKLVVRRPSNRQKVYFHIKKMAAIIRSLPARKGSLTDDGDINYQRFLSKFQVEKFTYMFNTFFDDANGDGLLQKVDVDALLERLAKYRNLDAKSEKYL